jgi:hypothetical protein
LCASAKLCSLHITPVVLPVEPVVLPVVEPLVLPVEPLVLPLVPVVEPLVPLDPDPLVPLDPLPLVPVVLPQGGVTQMPGAYPGFCREHAVTNDNPNASEIEMGLMRARLRIKRMDLP